MSWVIMRDGSVAMVAWYGWPEAEDIDPTITAGNSGKQDEGSRSDAWKSQACMIGYFTPLRMNECANF
jgi:hypothetical protein